MNIESLDLESNPISQLDGYKEKIFELIPSLVILDGFDREGQEVISEDEDDYGEEEEGEADLKEGEGFDDSDYGDEDYDDEEAGEDDYDDEDEEDSHNQAGGPNKRQK